MSDVGNDNDRNRNYNLLQQFALMNLSHGEEETTGVGGDSRHFANEILGNEDINGNILIADHDEKETSLGTFGHNATPPTSIHTAESGNGVTPQCLEDYKCPICLDTFINTVKVDCSYGHKFCNFCIQCWINFERHLVTECPVCRGPIFGKSLDLKTDAEIRAVYDTFSEDEKRARLLSIKERLQLEYPNTNIHQVPTGFQIPMRFSNSTHNHFNHDLHIPIPLIGVVEGEALPFPTNPLYENGLVPNYGERTPFVWPTPAFLYPPTWNGSYSRDFQHMTNEQQLSDFPAHPTFDNADADVHHQHFHHQSQENSRWDNNLYVTLEDTATPSRLSSTSGRIHSSISHPPLMDPIGTSRQNQLHDAAHSRAHSFQASTTRLPQQNCSYNNLLQEYARLNLQMPNYPVDTIQNSIQVDQYPFLYSLSHSQQMPQVTPQSRLATPNHANGLYCCYQPTNQTRSRTSTTQFMTPHNNIQQPTNSHTSINGYCGHHHQQMQCHNVNGGYSSNNICLSPTPTNEVEISSSHTFSENAAAMSHSPPRIRPNMPGASSASFQLPSPSNTANARSRTPTPSYHHMPTSSSSNAQTAQPQATIRQQPVSRCPSHNTRAHFSGGFSLFSSGYIGFQISHIPTAMMVGDRYVSTPPARLTHPLVSLMPLNQDGSSTRVCLTFEVHRV